VACGTTFLQSILTIHVVLLPQVFVFQYFVCTVDAQKFCMCIWILLQQQFVVTITKCVLTRSTKKSQIHNIFMENVELLDFVIKNKLKY